MKLRNALPALVLAGLPLLTGRAAADDRPADAPTITLSELVAKVHARTGRQFILEPSVGDVRLSLAGMDVTKLDYPMLLIVLRYRGLVAFEQKEATSILVDRDARQLPTPVLTADDPTLGDDVMVTRLVQVQKACAAHMVPVLRPLMPQAAHLAAYPLTNTLILMDYADNARRIVDLVERIDRAAPGKLSCSAGSKSGS